MSTNRLPLSQDAAFCRKRVSPFSPPARHRYFPRPSYPARWPEAEPVLASHSFPRKGVFTRPRPVAVICCSRILHCTT